MKPCQLRGHWGLRRVSKLGGTDNQANLANNGDWMGANLSSDLGKPKKLDNLDE